MECGQYDPRWSAIHMLPEETVQAHIDVQGELLLPIHWGAFTLALHEWSDPIERVTKEANRLGVKITTPQIGESITLKSTDYPRYAWWQKSNYNKSESVSYRRFAFFLLIIMYFYKLIKLVYFFNEWIMITFFKFS